MYMESYVLYVYKKYFIDWQEVETQAFESVFVPALRQEGYIGVFVAKTRNRTLSMEEKMELDGCAIFYKSEK